MPSSYGKERGEFPIAFSLEIDFPLGVAGYELTEGAMGMVDPDPLASVSATGRQVDRALDSLPSKALLLPQTFN